MTPGRPPRGGGGSDPKNWPVRSTASYGGVVVRDGADGPEVVMIRPLDPDKADDEKQVWALPKGMKEKGERPEVAAVREVLEETGIESEIVRPLEAITYWFAWAPEQVRYRKTVHFFLMRQTGGEIRPDAVEVAEVRWFPLASSPKKATYPSERKVLEEAGELVSGS